MHSETPSFRVGATAVAYTYGTWRGHAKGSITWADIQPTKGSYSGTGSDQGSMVLDWTKFDQIKTEAIARGVGICFNMYRTPSWASRAVDQVGGSNTVIGAWGDAGESAVPEKLQYLTDIVTAVLQRGNAGTRVITSVQPLNEPEFYTAPELAAYIAASGRPFWTGTAAQCVDYVWTVRQAVKAYDATIPVIAPAQYLPSRLTAFLGATGPVSSKVGWETFDWLAVHPYTTGPNKAMTGDDIYYGGARMGMLSAQNILRGFTAIPKPVAITEWGVDSGLGSGLVAAFNAQSSAIKKTYISRLFANAALNGCPLIAPFSYDAVPSADSLAGEYTVDTTGVIAAVTDVQTKLAGKTIVAGGTLADGGVTVTLSTGETWQW